MAKQLGDFVEKVIKKTVPKIAEKAKQSGCNCDNRRIWLNNFGANFSK
ncbi:hypothetical protein Phi19:2_gp020 [Cellulophaga phage phi19:2]|uniref:Uncharacterized protein n=3 Tax=Cellulophaga phage phiST TaxID=756282 RepID=R9ZVG3_9CAUD|nr:hypothetical protein PhiST_gp020 [Cellulophaga phage phiST]AGO48655.1 hypothetical protein Phi19:2_gp020 [Cellulophaga phage phi19:2]AGO49025.1 hypothetical protein Phi13:1_gp014 [Cellulophaga phage phi13:1]